MAMRPDSYAIRRCLQAAGLIPLGAYAQADTAAPFADRVRAMAARFRVLRGWTVVPQETPDLANECTIHVEEARAEVRPWAMGGAPEPADYVFHECMHVALAALARWEAEHEGDHDAEEAFVQDVCAVAFPGAVVAG
jgi:hypothetical protein